MICQNCKQPFPRTGNKISEDEYKCPYCKNRLKLETGIQQMNLNYNDLNKDHIRIGRENKQLKRENQYLQEEGNGWKKLLMTSSKLNDEKDLESKEWEQKYRNWYNECEKLELQITQAQEEVGTWKHTASNYNYEIKVLVKRIKKQMEEGESTFQRMKNCQNCDHFNWGCCLSLEKQLECIPDQIHWKLEET